jgi:hypothetical protein
VHALSVMTRLVEAPDYRLSSVPLPESQESRVDASGPV